MENSYIIKFDIKKYYTPFKKYGEFDTKREYRILVPLNKEAEEQMYRYQIYDGSAISPDFKCLEFFEETFYIMDDFFFVPLNQKFDLIITSEEEDVIYTEQLDEAKALVMKIIDNIDDPAAIDFGNILLKMIMEAEKYNTVVGFYF